MVTGTTETEARARDRRWLGGDFLRLWLAQVCAAAGNGISRLAMPLLVLSLTGSSAQAGFVAAAQTVPFLVLGLPAGALIDRWNRRLVLIACLSARGLAIGSVPLAWMLGHLTAPHLLAVALVQGSATVFISLAQVAALPRVVPRARLVAAQALTTASEGIAALTTPGVAGVIIGLAATTVAGAVLAQGVDAGFVLLAVVILATGRARLQADRPTDSSAALVSAIADGMRYVRASRPIWLLALVNMAHRMCLAAVPLSVIVLARDHLAADPARIGLLFSAVGGGGLLAAVVTPRVRRRVPVGWTMLGLMSVHALALATMGAASELTLVLVGMALYGMMDTMSSITQVAYRLAFIPDALQGRVNSVYRLLSFSAMSVGTAAGGLLIELTGPRLVLVLLAAIIATTALAGAAAGITRLED